MVNTEYYLWYKGNYSSKTGSMLILIGEGVRHEILWVISSVSAPLRACATANAWKVFRKLESTQLAKAQKLQHQNRSIFKRDTVYNLGSLRITKMNM